MVETIGRKLREARLERKISVGEASRATKIRPDRVNDLENDDYSNFPNLAYAKGFLLIYAKYLAVDVSGFADTLSEGSNSVGVDEYDYLTNGPVTRPTVIRHRPKRSMRPWIIAAVIAVVLLFVWYLSISIRRLGDLERLAENPPAASQAAPSPDVAVTAPSPPPRPSRAAGRPPLEPIMAAVPAPTPEPPAALTPATPSEEGAKVRRALPVDGTEPNADAPVHEVSLFPVKKTWVKVRRDDPESAPIFEDWLFPEGRPLNFRGGRFFIEVSEDDGVEIRKNGEVVAYQSPGITIE